MATSGTPRAAGRLRFWQGEDVIDPDATFKARVYDAWMTGPSAMGSL